ncbi:MAG: hypothetical protein AAGJ80_06395, partial [Cyanobacteria bacterium J06553_1]
SLLISELYVWNGAKTGTVAQGGTVCHVYLLCWVQGRRVPTVGDALASYFVPMMGYGPGSGDATMTVPPEGPTMVGPIRWFHHDRTTSLGPPW